MRKAMLALAGLLLLAVLAAGVIGSGAWFTDQATVPVSATSAKLDIRAQVGKENQAPSIYNPSGVPIAVSNLAPGVYDPANVYMIDVQNGPAVDSTLAVKYRYSAVSASAVNPLFDNTVVKVETGFCVGDTISSPTTVYAGPLKNLSFSNESIGKPDLPVNTTACYRFSFKLADAAGNELQGKTGVFSIVIDATQPENPGW